MATLDQLRKKDREWAEHAKRSAEAVMRAAGLQARQYGIANPLIAASELADLYSARHKKSDWREFGNVAFHLAATWPPDLAYFVLYAMRDLQPPLEYDPVPLIMKAIEMLPHLRCENVTLHVGPGERARKLAEDLDERSKACARILVRELSCVPLRWAAGIYSEMDRDMQSHVKAELERFNPKASSILLAGDWSWLLTLSGLSRMVCNLKRFVLRLLFGRS